ncbi:MAG TPA: hypothetical protein VK841_21520 [Polyangiaceae bacterium]|nr:hypothetical protein [Polyangiaceae bacterium]
MKHRFASFKSAATAFFGIALLSTAARAQQIDTNPPVPNVLILLDNSGSMERMIDGTTPESNPANTCNCDATTGNCQWSLPPQANRWNTVQQALTGSLQNGFNCVAMPRTSGSVFANEYQINGAAPYDNGYYLPFHRMVAQDNSATPSVPCVVAPGVLPGASTPNGVGLAGAGGGGLATDFTGSIITRPYPYNSASPTTTSCQFSQLSNGAINTMTDLMRFGLMTFDQDPNAATGTNTPLLTVASNAFQGMWTYYPGWNFGQACTIAGGPANCATLTTFAVGARNPAAPPWEGRMVGFPTTNAIADQETNNGQIASVITASRPYGATPLDGMLYGAQYYFQTDPSGPQTDPFVTGGCRPEYIILLTDGAPNDDMRPSCSAAPDGGTAGTCPFPLPPETVVQNLYNNGQRVGTQQFVTTYVIGFAVSSVQEDQGQLANCSQLTWTGGQANPQCIPAVGQTLSPALQACCELQEIAFEGGSSQAYFADTPGDLQKALGAILANIAKNATTRTAPAFSPVLTSAPTGNTTTAALQTSTSSFLASFNPAPGAPWSGDVQRERFACSQANSSAPFTAAAQQITPALGDDFKQNLNSNSSPRNFIAFNPGPAPGGGTVADSTQTIRPNISATAGDGLPVYVPTTVPGQASAVMPLISPDALGIPLSGAHPGCQYTPINAPGPSYLTPTQCRDMLLDFTFAQPSFTGPSDFSFVSRSGNAFGDVFHASPVVVGPPQALFRDPAYEAFRQTWNAVPANSGIGTTTGTTKPRDTVVYVATNDGLLHAFWADEPLLANNEEWALIPPAVMPNLQSTYPSSHQFLLDGTPVVKDVVWDRCSGLFGTSGSSGSSGSSSGSSGSSSGSTGSCGTSTTNPWHSTLVAGFGPYQRGYYGVDVTNPDVSGLVTHTSTLVPPGPAFLWQLTKMPATNYPIFAAQSAIPAITTLSIADSSGQLHEVGVAVLPGGVDTGGPTSSLTLGGPSCTRAMKMTDAAPIGAFTARTAVRCWGTKQNPSDPVNGRALSIVRLDTGEILQVFARNADFSGYPNDTLVKANRVRDTPLDSPMTGTPVVYPGDVGAVATTIYEGDADGTIWRFDVSSTDPTQWSGALFLDLYNQQADTSTTAWADGQPFEVPMVSSLDTAGELVLSAATGSIETFDTTGTNYVYSVTDRLQGTTPAPHAFVNWYLGSNSGMASLRAGERVSGPMTVFNGTLYFSTYYAAASTSATACSSGDARIFGWDFVLPQDTTCSPTDDSVPCSRNLGGVRELAIPQASTPQDFYEATTTGAAQGAVLPGVSIQATPACGSISQAQSDQYVAGGTHRSLSNLSPPSYSLIAQVGANNTPGGGNSTATQEMQVPLQAPASPTIISSWASVLE